MGRLESISITDFAPESSTTAIEFDWHLSKMIFIGMRGRVPTCSYEGTEHYLVNTRVSGSPMPEFTDFINKNGTAAQSQGLELKWRLEAAGPEGVKLHVMEQGKV